MSNKEGQKGYIDLLSRAGVMPRGHIAPFSRHGAIPAAPPPTWRLDANKLVFIRRHGINGLTVPAAADN
jgi:hypothetical protein